MPQKAYNRVKEKNRNSLIFSSKRPKKLETVRVITHYSNQYIQIKQILSKFWPLLSADPVIKKYVKEFPEIMYRRAPLLKDHLVHSYFDVSGSTKTMTNFGPFSCGRFDICHFVKNKSKFKLPNCHLYSIKHSHLPNTRSHLSGPMSLRWLLCWEDQVSVFLNG